MAKKKEVALKTTKLEVKSPDHYKKESFIYPDQGLMPDKKQEDYHKMWCEKIYSLYQNGATWIGTDTKASIEENRAWSNGTHDTSFAVEAIFGTKDDSPINKSNFDSSGYDNREEANNGSGKKAWINLDLSPVSVAPKIKTKINEHTRAMYYEMGVNAIDSFSVRNEESEKYKLWFYKQNQKWIDSQRVIAGVGVEEPSFMPQNLEELELYAASGGFKVPYAITMEDLLKHSFEVSDWDKEVGEKVKDDLISNGFAIIKEEFDKEINRVVVKYIDIQAAGLQFSTTKSFKNAEFGYHESLEEVSKLRQRLNLTEEQASSLAQAYVGQYGNPTRERWANYNKIVGEGMTSYLGFDAFKVPVFNCEWVDIDNEQYVEFLNSFGDKRTKKYNGQIQDNEELRDDQIRYVRKCSWVVGTDFVFDWGKSEYIPRDKFKVPRLSYRGVMLNTAPIIPQIKPFLKGFQLSWIKAQHAISQAIGNGFAVDIGAIKEISIGKDKSWDSMELLEFYKQSSFLLYKQKNSLSGFGRSAGPPVIPLNNSSYENIKIQFDSMAKYLSLIESTSGISGISTGEQADPNVAKFNMQISLQGTNEIINNIVRAVTDIQEDVSVNICYKIRTYCHMNKFIADSYAEVVGEQRMKAVLDAEKNHVEYGISISATDITEKKRNIMEMLKVFSTPSADGTTHLPEAMQILDMIETGQNIRRIGILLGYMMKKKADEDHQKALDRSKAQSEGLAQIEQQKQKAALQAQDFEFEKIKREFRKEFIIKWGKTPETMLGNEGMDTAQQAPSPEMAQPEIQQPTQ